MAEESKLDQVRELLDGLDTELDDDEVPATLKNIIAVGDGISEEQIRKNLASAIVITAGGEPVNGIPESEMDPDGLDIVVKERLPTYKPNGDISKEGKPATTVKQLVEESTESATALALVLDKYIRLVVRKMVAEESLIE